MKGRQRRSHHRTNFYQSIGWRGFVRRKLPHAGMQTWRHAEMSRQHTRHNDRQHAESFADLLQSLTISVLVEKAEGLLEFGNLLFGQLVSHGYEVVGGIARKRQTARRRCCCGLLMDKSDRGGPGQGERDRLPVPRFGSFGALGKGHRVIFVCPATDCRISSSESMTSAVSHRS
jgi:hypothetical protein